MATVSQSLTNAIPGLFRERANDPTKRSSALEIAPLVTQNSLGQYQIMVSDLRLDERDASQGAELGDSADFSPGSIEYGSVSVVTKRYGANSFHIPDRVVLALQNNNAQLDVARSAMNFVSDQLYGRFTKITIDAATAGLTASGAGVLDLSTGGATDLVSYFSEVVHEILLGSTQRPNYIYMGPLVRHALRNMDSIQGGVAIASAASPTADRRTGYVSFGEIDSFFAEYGLTVITDDTSFVNTAGTPAFLLSNKVIVGRAEAGGRSALHTFVQREGANDDLMKFYVREAANLAAPGIYVAGDMRIKVEVTDPQLARILTVTLP